MIDRYDVIELSKIYKRLLEVELTLKQKIIFALEKTYAEKAFYRLIPYIKSLDHNIKENLKLIENTLITDEVKLKRFMANAYISDVVNILTRYKNIYKFKLFQQNFYGYEMDNTKHAEVISYAGRLVSLRNSIMHFNITSYKNNKDHYLKTLIYWEKLIEVPKMQYIHNLSLNKKPRMTTVLKALSDTYPDFLSLSDRLVCDMFYDIAFINGWGINELPQYWSIGRALYELRRQKKKKQAL